MSFSKALLFASATCAGNFKPSILVDKSKTYIYFVLMNLFLIIISTID